MQHVAIGQNHILDDGVPLKVVEPFGERLKEKEKSRFKLKQIYQKPPLLGTNGMDVSLGD